MTAIIVPVKRLETSKQRLVSVLQPAQRWELARAMVCDVFATLRCVRPPDHVVVVTPGRSVASLAAEHGFEILEDVDCAGETAAVAIALCCCKESGADAILILPADIPLLQPDDVQRILGEHRRGSSVVLVPSRDGRGTNAILCAPADLIQLRFGGNSFAYHVAEARRAGHVPRVLRLPRVALDLDTPEDLQRFLSWPNNSTRAYRQLCQAERVHACS